MMTSSVPPNVPSEESTRQKMMAEISSRNFSDIDANPPRGRPLKKKIREQTAKHRSDECAKYMTPKISLLTTAL